MKEIHLYKEKALNTINRRGRMKTVKTVNVFKNVNL